MGVATSSGKTCHRRVRRAVSCWDLLCHPSLTPIGGAPALKPMRMGVCAMLLLESPEPKLNLFKASYALDSGLNLIDLVMICSMEYSSSPSQISANSSGSTCSPQERNRNSVHSSKCVSYVKRSRSHQSLRPMMCAVIFFPWVHLESRSLNS